MDKSKRRRRSVILFGILALIAGIVVFVASLSGRPEAVRTFWATARFEPSGTTQVSESIWYYFSQKRHGIYRNLRGVPWDARDQIRVTADHTSTFVIEPDVTDIRSQMDAQGVDHLTVDSSAITDVKVRIGDPGKKVSGDHHYTIDYPLAGADLGDGRFGWNGVGAAWTVPIDHAELDLVAPWEWSNPRCDAGSTGAVEGCTVEQVAPGHLVVSHGHLAAGEGITVYADRGKALAVAPEPRTPAPVDQALPLWSSPIVLALVTFALLLVAALVVARSLRRAGRDWVVAGAASTNSAADLAFAAPGAVVSDAGMTRVDDTRLAEWATTEFAPPSGLTAWQGGVLAAERPLPEHRVAWLLGTAVDGYIDIASAGPGAVRVRRLDHAADATTLLLDVAFAGRDELLLGPYDPRFSALWTSLGSKQKQWLRSSGFLDVDADKRVGLARVLGCVGVLGATAVGIALAALSSQLGLLSTVGVAITAVFGGIASAAVIRAWELHVRTPAGSAVWLRVESFRRFLHGSEAHHVQEAAERGVLREYAAWATALGEAEHWNAAVEAAGLPPSTPGLSTALLASSMARACTSSSTAPSSSGGGGGGGGGVGGGGGGGGGGSW